MRTLKRCKTLKNNVTDDCLVVVDRISTLPEELLSRVLCLLPTKEAVCTSILSRRWRRVYSWLTNLEFDALLLSHSSDDCRQQRISCFITHVNTVLRVCHSLNLTRFCLKLGKVYNGFDLESTHLNSWISFPLTRTVREIDLFVHVKQPGKLPHQLFTLDMVQVLKINSNLELENPGSFGLLNLKVLHLTQVIIPDGHFLTDLLSSCPSLAELEVKKCFCANSLTMKISHPFLKRMYLDMPPVKTYKEARYVPGVGLQHVIVRDDYQRTDVVLDTPNLQYLGYVDNMALRYSAGNLNALVEATINIRERFEYEETYFQSMLSLLSSLSNVQSLSLADGSQPEQSEPVQLKEKLVLPNLNHLELYMFDFSYCFVLLDLLHCCPILERLTLPDGGGMKEDELVDANVYARLTTELDCTTQRIPSCLRSHLKKIVVGRYSAIEEDFVLLKYLLRNAVVLQELDVAACSHVDIMQTEITLKNLPRKSLNCSIKVRFRD